MVGKTTPSQKRRFSSRKKPRLSTPQKEEDTALLIQEFLHKLLHLITKITTPDVLNNPDINLGNLTKLCQAAKYLTDATADKCNKRTPVSIHPDELKKAAQMIDLPVEKK